MKNKITIGIKLVSIEDNSITINNANKITKDEALEKCGFHIGTHLIINKEKSLIGLRMDFSLVIQDDVIRKRLQDANQLPEFSYSGTVMFHSSGLDLSTGPDKKVSISIEFMHKLAEVCYSTFRGIIFAKTIGTSLQGALLPVINDAQIASMVNQGVSN